MKMYLNVGVLSIAYWFSTLTEIESKCMAANLGQLHYNYLVSDSILIDCKLKVFTNYSDIVVVLGQPDTLIRHQITDDFYDKPYSYVLYRDMKLRLFDNDNIQLSSLSFSLSEHNVCYNNIRLNRETTLLELKDIFPLSYGKRDAIMMGDKQYIAMRFFTSDTPTDSEWIMLFNNDKLNYLNYFDGND